MRQSGRLSLLRSERAAAVLLLVAAAVGLALANSPVSEWVLAAKTQHLALPALGLDLSAEHWISDGLLAIFFFIVAVEIKRELVVGELSTAAKAMLPACAALGGVVVPAVVYLGFTAGTSSAPGWPIPTATDIAFALGILAIFGRFLPPMVRVFLLALAVLDDLIAITFIAVLFTTDLHLAYLIPAVISVAAFGALTRLLRPRSRWLLTRRPTWPITIALILLGALTWFFVYQSGIHATIAGVVLGLVASRRPAGHAAHRLEPFSNVVILPLFALTAAMVAIPHVAASELLPAFWGILVALPVGKLVGIVAGGLVGAALLRGRTAHPVATLPLSDLIAVAALGGVGFTVALLMNSLAFAGDGDTIDQGTIAVLLGSAIAIVLSATLVSLRNRQHRIRSQTASSSMAGS